MRVSGRMSAWFRPSAFRRRAQKWTFHDDGTFLSVVAVPHGFEAQLCIERLGCHRRGHSQDRNVPLDRCSLHFSHAYVRSDHHIVGNVQATKVIESAVLIYEDISSDADFV